MLLAFWRTAHKPVRVGWKTPNPSLCMGWDQHSRMLSCYHKWAFSASFKGGCSLKRWLELLLTNWKSFSLSPHSTVGFKKKAPWDWQPVRCSARREDVLMVIHNRSACIWFPPRLDPCARKKHSPTSSSFLSHLQVRGEKHWNLDSITSSESGGGTAKGKRADERSKTNHFYKYVYWYPLIYSCTTLSFKPVLCVSF